MKCLKSISIIVSMLISSLPIFSSKESETKIIKGNSQIYEVKKETTTIPMRDKINLSTDLFFPEGINDKSPVILIRTYVNKSLIGYIPYYFAAQGYVVAVQDVRGRFASEGIWEPFINEADDGYDTIEWLAKQEWCNGKVGMMGGSYMAQAQLLAAINHPPHLTAIIPHNLPADPYKNAPFENGILLLAPELWWINLIETKLEYNNPKVLLESHKVKVDTNLIHLPVEDIDRLITGKEVPYFRNWIEHNTMDSYWEKASYQKELRNLNIPVLLQSGWYDTHSIGTTITWKELSNSDNKNVMMIIGPWNHANGIPSYLPVNKVGKEANIDLLDLYLKWFDFWLKEIDNKIMEEPKAKLYIINDFRWINSSNYPVSQTIYRKLFFNSNKGANTLKGDGSLDWYSSNSGKSFDSYRYNPGDPTPAFIYRNSQGRIISDSITSKRKDILVYESDQLDSAYTILGPISTSLFASSNCPDTDWFVYLYAITNENEYLPVTHGCMRARFRNSFSKPEMLAKNKIYEYSIDLWHTGIKLDKGWKIRIEISSSDFPQYSRNLNTGRNNEKESIYKSSYQKIFHSKKYQSFISLPIISIN